MDNELVVENQSYNVSKEVKDDDETKQQNEVLIKEVSTAVKESSDDESVMNAADVNLCSKTASVKEGYVANLANISVKKCPCIGDLVKDPSITNVEVLKTVPEENVKSKGYSGQYCQFWCLYESNLKVQLNLYCV